MSTAPYHIKMIQKLSPADRTDEEAQMLIDYAAGKNDYGTGGTFSGANDTWKDKWGGQQVPKYNAFKRCYEDHPALTLNLSGGNQVRYVYGGSCSKPVVKADIYIGLDYSMYDHKERFPWEPGEAIHYEIIDGKIPKDIPEFHQLIAWLAQQIKENKKVHIGCIGGHGRTGTLLAALVAVLTDEVDPIKYVRDNYCKKAVESKVQVNMLVKEFGCLPAVGSKEHYHTGTSKKGYTSKGSPSASKITPIKASHCLWPDYHVDE